MARDCPQNIRNPNELIEQDQLEKLCKMFVTVSPVIMREIGPRAKSKDFDGAFNNLSNRFKASMKSLFSGQLALNELGDYNRTCAQLVPLIEGLVELFNKLKTPALHEIRLTIQGGQARGQVDLIKVFD